MHRVLLVDDQQMFLDVSRDLLTSHPEIEVVGEAHNGEEAMAWAEALHPDVVVLDVQMPGLNGFQTARRLLAMLPDAKVVLVSAFEEPEYHDLAHAIGAVGFIVKNELSAERVLDLTSS